MDVVYYLHREQVERMRAEQAHASAAADAHRDLAKLYRQEVDRYRAENPLPPHQVPSGRPAAR